MEKNYTFQISECVVYLCIFQVHLLTGKLAFILFWHETVVCMPVATSNFAVKYLDRLKMLFVLFILLLCASTLCHGQCTNHITREDFSERSLIANLLSVVKNTKKLLSKGMLCTNRPCDLQLFFSRKNLHRYCYACYGLLQLMVDFRLSFS